VGVPGGEVVISCRGFEPGLPDTAGVLFGTEEGRIVAASEDRVTARVPEAGQTLGVGLRVGQARSSLCPFSVAARVASNLHPVSSPAVAADGSAITTVSGSRGERTDEPLVRVTRAGERIAFSCEIMNPTGLAFGADGQLYVSSRSEGVVYRYRDFDNLEVVADDLGIACGIAFDSEGVLFVGDRAGRIVRVRPGGNKEVFARLEPSVSAYHLAFDAEDRLYVTGPTFSTRDVLYRIDRGGTATAVATGLGRPQGMTRLPSGELLVTATYRGKKGVFRFDPQHGLEHHVAAPTLVGVAAGADGALWLADGSSLYRVEPATAGVV
jgi:sugar lactone lactonase YvrE